MCMYVYVCVCLCMLYVPCVAIVQLSNEYMARFTVYTDLRKELERQKDLFHAVILTRVDESQGHSSSLTRVTRAKLAKQAKQARQEKIKRQRQRMMNQQPVREHTCTRCCS